MLNKTVLGKSSVAYHVEKTIEIVANIAGGPATVRIDALRSLTGGHYCTRAYVKEDIIAQPEFPQTYGTYDRPPGRFQDWISYSLPSTRRDSADEALAQTPGFLAEQVKN